MVMASIFESFFQPFLILFTIPMAGIGVVGLFILMGQSLNVMAFIGIVMLGGIVVNNAIVLLDCVNQVREDKTVSDEDSILIGCDRRLRPVFMTTGTTFAGPPAAGAGHRRWRGTSSGHGCRRHRWPAVVHGAHAVRDTRLPELSG
jgi:multidrug efflux pump subunit AcrB